MISLSATRNITPEFTANITTLTKIISTRQTSINKLREFIMNTKSPEQETDLSATELPLVINKKYTQDEIDLLLSSPIPKRLELLNKMCKVSTKDVCRTINISAGHYYRLTNGKCAISYPIATKLSNLFNIKIEFFGYTEDEKNNLEEKLSKNDFFDRRAFLLFNSVNNDEKSHYVKHIHQIIANSYGFQEEVFPQDFSMVASNPNLNKLSIYPDVIMEVFYIGRKDEGSSSDTEIESLLSLDLLKGKMVRTKSGVYGLLTKRKSGYYVQPLNQDFDREDVQDISDIEVLIISIKHETLSLNDLLCSMFNKHNIMN